MARVKFGSIVTKVSGSIGGATFQRSSFGNTLRSKPLPIHSRNITQLQRRAYMHDLQNEWNNLSDDGRKKWKQFIAYSGQSIIADSNVLLSGYNLFLKYQFCRLMYGLPILVNFTYIPIPTWPRSFLVYANSNQIYAKFVTDLSTDEYFFILCLSNPRNPSNSYSPVNGRFMLCSLSGSNTFVFSESYAANFGILPVNGNTLHYSIYYFSLKAPLLSGFQTGKLIVGQPEAAGWVVKTTPTLSNYSSVAAKRNEFLASSFNLSNNRLNTSADGETWIPSTASISGAISAVCYRDTSAIAITYNSAVAALYYRDGGGTWVAIGSDTSEKWKCLASNGSDVIGLTESPDSCSMLISHDDTDISVYPLINHTQFSAIAWGTDRFIATQHDPYKLVHFTQSGGSNWSLTIYNSIRNWNTICFGNGIWVVASQDNAGVIFGASADGINFQISAVFPMQYIFSIAAGNGDFVAVGASDSNDIVLRSSDGINWIAEQIPTACTINSICFAQGSYVAVSADTSVILICK